MINFTGHPHFLRRIILTTACVISIIVIGYWLEHHVATLEAWLAEMGVWAGIGFIVLFIVLTPFLFSVDILCIIAGALFSLDQAVAYVLTATMLAAAVIFYVGRHIIKDKAQILLQKHPKLTIYDRLIEENGFKVMFLLRLLPFPFALMSYMFSITRVQFLPYLLATTGIFIYNSAIVYFGYIAKHMTKQLSQGVNYSGPHNVMLTGGILGSILILFIVAKIAHSQIEKMSIEQKS
jgi:uncharacterized membrane protein YdjX (TVP38/TMEM64 family)